MQIWLRGVSLAMVWVGVFSSTVVAAGFPSNAYLGKQFDWFRGADGKRVVENVVSHQSVSGGWPKNLDTGEKPYRGNPAGLRGTFDNGAGRGELRFMARAYRASGDTRPHVAFLKGLDHILKAQYPNGGWPQTYPLGSGYSRHITFNDGTMIGPMRLLRDVAESLRDRHQPADLQRPRRCDQVRDHPNRARATQRILLVRLLGPGGPPAVAAMEAEMWTAERQSLINMTYMRINLGDCRITVSKGSFQPASRLR